MVLPWRLESELELERIMAYALPVPDSMTYSCRIMRFRV